MTRVSFFKMAGAGNDFILLVDPPKSALNSRLTPRLCDRRRGVGADGLLILGLKNSGPDLAYFNADGSRAFCGNGTRCAAWWLHEHRRVSGKTFMLRADGGPVKAEIAGANRVSIRMPRPSPVKLGLKVSAGGRRYLAHWINTGVPHAVIESANLGSVPIKSAGPLLRRHKIFGPAGANVDFARLGRTRLALRTFERGVEAETLACGTGAVAAACVARALGRSTSDLIRARTAGGDVLNVIFKQGAGGGDEVWLEGPAAQTFSGEITL